MAHEELGEAMAVDSEHHIDLPATSAPMELSDVVGAPGADASAPPSLDESATVLESTAAGVGHASNTNVVDVVEMTAAASNSSNPANLVNTLENPDFAGVVDDSDPAASIVGEDSGPIEEAQSGASIEAMATSKSTQPERVDNSMDVETAASVSAEAPAEEAEPAEADSGDGEAESSSGNGDCRACESGAHVAHTCDRRKKPVSQKAASKPAAKPAQRKPVSRRVAQVAAEVEAEARRSKRARRAPVTFAEELEAQEAAAAASRSESEAEGTGNEDEEDSEEEDPDKVYCICRKPDDGEEPMIFCDFCDDWFHYSCVGLTESKAKRIKGTWLCPQCEEISEGTAAAAIEESPSRKRKATDSKKARRPKSGQKRSAEKERQSKSSRAAPKPKKPKPAVEYKSDDDEDVLEEEDTNLFDRESDDDYAPNEDAAPSAPKVAMPTGTASVPDAFFAMLATAQTSAAPPASKPPQSTSSRQSRARPRASSVPESPSPVSRQSSKQVVASSREKFAGTIAAMVKRSRAKGAGEKADSISKKIEAALYNLYDSSIEQEYLRHLKRLVANLRTNTTLVERLLSGNLTAHALVRLSPEELVTDEVLKMREVAKEKAMQAVAVEPTEIRIITHNDKDQDRKVKDDAVESVVHDTDTHKPKENVEALDPTSENSVVAPEETPEEETKDEEPVRKFDVSNIVLPTSRHVLPPSAPSTSVASSGDADTQTSRTAPVVQDLHSDGVDEGTVWSGTIKNGGHTKVKVDAKIALRQSADLDVSGILPATLEVHGRIRPSEVWGYLKKLKETESGSREIIILLLDTSADADDDGVDFTSLYSYFHSRQRIGVINTKRMPEVKDFYIVPVSKTSPLPSTFTDGSMYGTGLDSSQEETLVAVITKSVGKKRKRGGSIDSTRTSKSLRRPQKQSPPREIEDVYTPFDSEAPYEPAADEAPVEAPYSPSYLGGDEETAPAAAAPAAAAPGSNPSFVNSSSGGTAASFAAPQSAAPQTAVPYGVQPSAPAVPGIGVDLGSIESLLATLNQQATQPSAPAASTAHAAPPQSAGGLAAPAVHTQQYSGVYNQGAQNSIPSYQAPNPGFQGGHMPPHGAHGGQYPGASYANPSMNAPRGPNPGFAPGQAQRHGFPPSGQSQGPSSGYTQRQYTQY